MSRCEDHTDMMIIVKDISTEVKQISAVVCGGIDKDGRPIKGILSRIQNTEMIQKFLLALLVPAIGGIILLIFGG